MNSSYDEVLKKSTSTWIFQRIELVLEFSRKQITPVPFNLVDIVFQVLKSMFCRTCSCWPCWCSDQFPQQTDLEILQKCFGTNTVPEYSEMYKNDKQMASLYHDIYGEFFSAQKYFEKSTESTTCTDVHSDDDLESEEKKRADYMRSCAELVTAMCTKRMYQEQDHMAKLQLKNSNTTNNLDFDLNDVQLMLVSLQQKIGIENENSNLQKEIEDIKNHIDTVAGRSLGKKTTITKRSTILLPLPTGST